jgi:hypothetical protein
MERAVEVSSGRDAWDLSSWSKKKRKAAAKTGGMLNIPG